MPAAVFVDETVHVTVRGRTYELRCRRVWNPEALTMGLNCISEAELARWFDVARKGGIYFVQEVEG